MRKTLKEKTSVISRLGNGVRCIVESRVGLTRFEQSGFDSSCLWLASEDCGRVFQNMFPRVRRVRSKDDGGKSNVSSPAKSVKKKRVAS